MIATFAAAPTFARGWSQDGYSAAATYFDSAEHSLGPGNVANLTETWAFERPWTYWFRSSEPVVSGKIAYFSLYDGFHAVNVSTGASEWTYEVGCPAQDAAAVLAGIAYFVGCEGALYALRASDGGLLWKTPLGATGAPMLGGSLLYIASGSDIYALNPATGARVWTYSNSSYPHRSTQLSYADDRVYFIAAGPGEESDAFVAAALNAKTGALSWTTSWTLLSSDAGQCSNIAVVKNVAYVWTMAGTSWGALYAISAKNGHAIWKVASHWFGGTIAVANGLVYGNFGGGITAVRANSSQAPKEAEEIPEGIVEWQIPEGNQESGPTVANGVIYFPAGGGEIEAANASDGAVLWSGPLLPSGGPVYAPVTVTAGQMLYESANVVTSFQLPKAG
jgi:outer membrane protein assembly factor BamB